MENNFSVQQDMLVSCQKITSPLRIRETAECYVFVYRPDTEEFIHGWGQLITPRGRKYVLWGPEQEDFLITVKKRVEISLVVDTMPVGDFERLKVIEKPRFRIAADVCVNNPRRLLERLDKQHLNLSAMEFCVRNVRHFRTVLEKKYRGGNSLSDLASRNTDLGRIFNRFGLMLANVKLVCLIDKRNN